MAKIGHTLARFPQNELTIHRLYAREPEFRGICEDYEEAVSALRRWQEVDAAKAEDFRLLALEIETEIQEFFTPPPGIQRPGS